MNDDNYVVIQGWMCNALKLSGNELLVFALIYGFSQDGESEFCGSRTYISNTFNISKPTVDKAIKSLIEKGLIIKSVTSINDMQINRYKVSLQGVKNLYRGSKESLPPAKETLLGGSKESLPNKYNKVNIINYSDNKELDTAIKDFIEHRKKMRKPMTSKAVDLFIKRLKQLSISEQNQIQMVNTAIERGWMTVYPVNGQSEKEAMKSNRSKNRLADLEKYYLEKV